MYAVTRTQTQTDENKKTDKETDEVAHTYFGKDVKRRGVKEYTVERMWTK